MLHEFYRNNRLNFSFSILGQVVEAGFSILISFFLGDIIDSIQMQSLSHLTRIGWTILLFLPCFLLSQCFFSRMYARFIHKALKQYKEKAFSMLSAKTLQAFTSENTGSYLSTLTNDIASIEENYLVATVDLVLQILLFFSALGVMLSRSPLLTLVVVLLSTLPILVSLLMGKGLATRERTVSDLNESFTTQMKDLLNGFSVIKCFQAEKQVTSLFDEKNQQLETAKEHRRFYASLINIVSSTAGCTMQFGIFLLGAYLAIRGQITGGTVIMFVQLCNYLISPIRVVPTYLAKRKAAKTLVTKLEGLLTQNQESNEEKLDAHLSDAICLSDLDFGYEKDHPVLYDITCSFEKGKSYAIVGGSGSGKSTLLNLMMGGYQNYDGSLAFDGTQVRDLSTESLYHLMGQISQNVFLFDDTIRNNITMFREFPEDEVKRAISLAGLDEIITERGENYRCGENGINLSGGERQRISIARSLLKGSKVLLVDEATSALDNETAKHISSSILNLKDLTRIVVTHRMEESILSRYDRIYVMKNGHLCEGGTFRELLDKKGHFYSLYMAAN
ncbi:ABC-type multidrug transport system, ATPase and permease component [Lachnospiraceae bacterium XBB1006]|nr:ABC-type multidrug transport system, ATPase and permease component [Lachnospiraceae bacterium XBB1006]